MDSIKGIRKKKSELQETIVNELRKFEEETGIRIDTIRYSRYDGYNVIIQVHIGLKL